MDASDELRKVQLDYIRMGTAMTAQLLRDIAEVGQDVARQADANAPASKIHGSVSSRAMMRGSAGSAEMKISGAKSQGAGPAFESISGKPTFRHPLYGNRRWWYTQPAQPFLRPAFEKGVEDAENRIGDAIEKAARASGWR